MSLHNFRTYQLAVQFHRSCIVEPVPQYLRDQLLRASSSVALNLAEGSAKPTTRDRVKYYNIAMGSLRECQAALDLAPKSSRQLILLADHLAASLYKLTRSVPAGQ